MKAQLGMRHTQLIIYTAGAAIAKIQGHTLFTKDLANRAILLRNAGDATGGICFIPALAMMPLSNISAILQSSPLLVTVGAALFLKEAVGWRRWTAILIGFVGVIIIIRPGMDGFNSASILALIGVVGLSVRDLVTRKINFEIPTVVVAASAYLTLTVAAFFLMLFMGGWQDMSSKAWAYMVAACIIGPIAYYAITLGMRIGEMSVIAPFRYTRMVFALLLGYLIFNEVPDFWMLFGSTLVIATGIYTLLRERKLQRQLKKV
ncbi:MAG: DMT family transporter [Ahrensia sp.]|nr:DMT family transporter [Ahrensia sp.]